MAGQGSNQESKARPGQRRIAQWTRDYARLPGIPDEYIGEDGAPRAAWSRFFDAFAALWTAERVVNGNAVILPPRPPHDGRGLPMRIVC